MGQNWPIFSKNSGAIFSASPPSKNAFYCIGYGKFRMCSFKGGKSPRMNNLPPILRAQAKRAFGEHMCRRSALRDQVPMARIARSRPQSGFTGAGGSQRGHSTRTRYKRADYATMYETAILRDHAPEGNLHRSVPKRFTLPCFKIAYYALIPIVARADS